MGEGKKGRVGHPSPGLPYLSDQLLPFSFHSLSLAWGTSQGSLPLVCRRKSLVLLGVDLYERGGGKHTPKSIFTLKWSVDSEDVKGPGVNRISLSLGSWKSKAGG